MPKLKAATSAGQKALKAKLSGSKQQPKGKAGKKK